MVLQKPEHLGNSAPAKSESAQAVVVQPSKVQFESFLESLGNIAENIGENGAGDWAGPSRGGAVAQTQTGGGTASVRDQSIAKLPAPIIMQKQLEKHIRNEVKKLRKQALHVSRLGHPGGAHNVNQLYAKIRSLNHLLSELFEASFEVLKRLFIRVFVDKQSIQ